MKQTQIRRSTAIENIDLAGEDKSLGPAKQTPRDMQALDKLHQSVNKRVPVATLTKNKPTLDFSSDDQPRLSFLRDDYRRSSTPKESADYGDNWTTDLPSPSELLNQTCKGISDTMQDGYKEIQISKTARDDTFDTNSLEEFDFTQFENDELDTEAALVGLSDSITMQEESNSERRVEKSSASKAATPPPSASTRIPEHRKASTSYLDKRPAETSQTIRQDNSFNHISNAPKRRKLDPPELEDKQTVAIFKQSLPTTINDIEFPPSQPPTGPVIKPGHPAWVYDFDPAFIAEYQDIVDFV